MVEVRIKGGLGNQLFQYATGYNLARRLNTNLILDISFFQNQSLRGFGLKYLQIDFSETENGSKNRKVEILKNKYLNKILRQIGKEVIVTGNDSRYILESKSELVPAFFYEKHSDLFLDGYYQSEKYFREVRKDLIRQFQPNYKSEEMYLNVLDYINSTNSVAVHVRRGDFLKAKNDLNPRHYLLGEKYYYNALDYIDSHLVKPVFFWFSDDIEWVKQNFGNKPNFYFIKLNTQHSDIDELMLMKSCNHIIAANSTFSWWGSWLNEKESAIHICPDKRYGNLEMIPDTWIRL